MLSQQLPLISQLCAKWYMCLLAWVTAVMPKCFTDTCSEPALFRLGLWWMVERCFKFVYVSTMALLIVRSSNVHLCYQRHVYSTNMCESSKLEHVQYSNHVQTQGSTFITPVSTKDCGKPIVHGCSKCVGIHNLHHCIPKQSEI